MSKDLTLTIYSKIGWLTIGIGVVVLLVSPVVRRWMHLDTLVDRVSPEDAAAEYGGRDESPATVALPARS